MKNILFIMGDQHRWDCIGAYGNKVLQTPNLDSLAKDGVLHKEHYMFFDLINDPYELKDVSNEDRYKEEIEKHKAFLAQTMTFDALSPIYLNEDEQPFNEAKRMNEQERREMEAYCMECLPYAIDNNK